MYISYGHILTIRILFLKNILGKGMDTRITRSMGLIVSRLFLYKNGIGIIYITKINMQ